MILEEIHQISELEIVGYNDQFSKETALGPCRVAPIFKNGQGLYVVNPFKIIGNNIIGGITMDEERFNRHIRRSVTILQNPIKPIPQGMLWIDENLELHYENEGKGNARLKQEAYNRLMKGYNDLRANRLEDSLRNAHWAFCANENSLDALALQLAVYIVRGETGAVNVFKLVAKGIPDSNLLERRAKYLVEEYQSNNQPNLSILP